MSTREEIVAAENALGSAIIAISRDVTEARKFVRSAQLHLETVMARTAPEPPPDIFATASAIIEAQAGLGKERP